MYHSRSEEEYIRPSFSERRKERKEETEGGKEGIRLSISDEGGRRHTRSLVDRNRLAWEGTEGGLEEGGRDGRLDLESPFSIFAALLL